MNYFLKIKIVSGEHAESAIKVSNCLEAFREFAELTVKVYLSMREKCLYIYIYIYKEIVFLLKIRLPMVSMPRVRSRVQIGGSLFASPLN